MKAKNKKPIEGSEVPTRVQILRTAARLTGVDREAIYGNSKDNMAHFAGLLTAYTGFLFTAEDAAVIMTLAKISRISVGKYHQDNYIDGAAYLAIAGECGEGEGDKSS